MSVILVEWFCLVSWPTFRGPVILPCILTYISWSSDFALYLELHFVVQWFWHILTYISWSSDFALYLELHFVVQWFWHILTYISWSSDFALHLDLHFVVQWFCLVSWPTFRGPVILPCILTYISWSSDFALYLDLHFVVQWFWLISWRCFDGGMLDWRFWFSVTLSLTYKYICWSVTFILWYSDCALYFNTIWWTSLILWLLVLIWAIDLYYLINWFRIIYLFLPIIVMCWSLMWKYLWM